MNKEQSLAAHRIKKSVVMAARNESLAKKKAKIAEAKVAKANEAFEVAKDIVAKQKKTLELAKQQILEQRELIKKYETLINCKYQQIEESKKSNDKANEALKARVTSFVSKYNENLKATEALEAKVAKQSKVLSQAKECILALREAKSRLEATIARRAKVESKDAKEIVNDTKLGKDVPAVKPKVAPEKEQAVKPAPADKPKVEVGEKVDLDKFNEEKAKKIAKIYNEKYGVDEKESMIIFGKYGMKEAIERIQTIADHSSKKQDEAKQRKIAKIYNEKYGVDEEESMKIFGEVADIKDAVKKIQTLANEKLAAKKESKKVVRPAMRRRVNKAAESVNKRIKRLPKRVESKSNKIDEAKAVKIAKIYNQKYKMDEKASMNILRAYDQKTALEKLQSIANVTKKYITESAPAVKNEAKVDEAKNSNLYSIFL